jgi:hypothetical protein
MKFELIHDRPDLPLAGPVTDGHSSAFDEDAEESIASSSNSGGSE